MTDVAVGAGPRTLVLACGALAREIRAVLEAAGLGDAVRLECLPAELHNRPESIGPALEHRLARHGRGAFDMILIGYADCGSRGEVDEVAARWHAERLPGPHCYSFYATDVVFDALQEAEPGTFYLTDYLVRFFDKLVWQGLGLDRHPELLQAYFGNYTRLVYLSQDPTAGLLDLARDAADRLGLRLEHRQVGYGELTPALLQLRPAPDRTARVAS